MKLTGTILRKTDEPDSHGDIIDYEGVELTKSMILVKSEFNEIVGEASISKGVYGLEASVQLFNTTKGNEISSAIDNGVPLYGTIGGKILKRNGHSIEGCIVDQVGITLTPSDNKLSPLKKVK